jgi:hypothetical protein
VVFPPLRLILSFALVTELRDFPSPDGVLTTGMQKPFWIGIWIGMGVCAGLEAAPEATPALTPAPKPQTAEVPPNVPSPPASVRPRGARGERSRDARTRDARTRGPEPKVTAGPQTPAPATGPGPTPADLTALVGSWQFTWFETGYQADFTFAADGTYINNEKNLKGTWKVVGDKIIMEMPDRETETIYLPIQPSGTKVTDQRKNRNITAVKASELQPSAPGPGPTPADLAALVGFWHFTWLETKFEQDFTFSANGTYNSDTGSEGTWKVVGDKIIMEMPGSATKTIYLPIQPSGTKVTDLRMNRNITAVKDKP